MHQSKIEQYSDTPCSSSYRAELKAARWAVSTAGKLREKFARERTALKSSARDEKPRGHSKRLSPLIQKMLDLSDRLPSRSGQTSLTPWLEQVFYVECPLTIALVAPDFIPRDEICVPAVEAMEKSVQELLDEDGWPHADVLPIFSCLLASWYRCWELIKRLKLPFDSQARSQLEWALRQALRMRRFDGTLVGDDQHAEKWTEKDFRHALKLSQDADDKALVKLLGDGKSMSRKRLQKLPESSSISEWGTSGILRSSWNRRACKLGFRYDNRSFWVELDTSRPLLAGTAMPDVLFDEHKLEPLEDFEIVCEQRDQEIDYVEFQMPLSQSVTLTRQLILLPADQVLIIADSVVANRTGMIDYQCRWPLAAGVEVIEESDTTEIYLANSTIQSLLLPLALSEWKVDRSAGFLKTHASNAPVESESISDPLKSPNLAADHDQRQKLLMKFASRGSAICVPLCFDLDRKRSTKQRTWRRLTVAENFAPVPSDQAAAFRVQLNKQQYLYYRALTNQGNRTFFGENFAGDFVFSRFKESGVVKELLRIE